MRILHLTAILLLAAALTAGGIYASLDITAPAPSSLAAYAPPGALLAIESPDFATLVASWNNSPEQRRWLAGDDYAAFSRSRLFGRLADAQNEFATAAGLTPDVRFLQQIAGSQSLFAWYDIGNLEFLYITRLSHEQVNQMPLLALRDKFEQRQAGGVTFYVRNSADAAPAIGPQASAPNSGDNPRTRTVAFALRGDTLLLATREDLIAGALDQFAKPGGRSLATDPWYAASLASTNEKPGDLRLILDLAKITRSPYFRSYWVQQNITATRRYTAALSDLYREPGVFREERFLLPSATSQAADTDLSPVLHFVPAGTVYRAVAHPSAEDTLAEIRNKVLVRTAANAQNPRQAPSAELTIPIAGDPSDLDNRIDTINVPSDASATGLQAVDTLLHTNTPIAMLSLSSAVPLDSGAKQKPLDRGNLFTAIHTGIVLEMPRPCDSTAWQHALVTALSPRVSVARAGLDWKQQLSGQSLWFQLDGAFPLAFAAAGNNCLIASDPGTLLAMLSASATQPQQSAASSIAGFSHMAQRGSLLKLVASLDHDNRPNPAAPGSNGRPPFFSGNLASLSDTFQNLDSETFTEFHVSPTLTRQTVLYILHQP